MVYLRKLRYHIVAAVLIAALTFPFGSVMEKNNKILAWWGTLYPEFCFMKKKEEIPEGAKPRFRFWIVENWESLLAHPELW